MLYLKIKHNLQKSLTYSQVEHTYILSAYNDLRNVHSIWVKKLWCIKWTWVMARLMNKNRAFVTQWGFGCLKWEQRERREGKRTQRRVTGVALTKMHDNCQALSKIKSKEICMKWSKQSTVYGEKKHKNTTENALLLLVECREYAIEFRGLSSVCVYVSWLTYFPHGPFGNRTKWPPQTLPQHPPSPEGMEKTKKKCNHIKTSFCSQQVQHALEQKIWCHI